jgi:PTH1 family peptidyl-tRNA hydrolase
MKLICGLGNPGPDYEDHRHNIGFRVVDALSDKAHAPLTQKKFDARIGQGSLGGEKVILLQPQTFMNLSGRSVAAALHFYKVPVDGLLVIHDELDLPFGRLQLKLGGGPGGHNGLKSISELLGDEGYARLRVGIGKPDGPNAKERVSGHVLSAFASEERKAVPELITRALDGAVVWTTEGMAAAMNRFNRRS